MFEVMASSIGFEFEEDVQIKLNREPISQSDWDMANEFVAENFPLSPDGADHGLSSNSCTIFLPEWEESVITENIDEVEMNDIYDNDFGADNEPFTEAMYEEASRIENADDLVMRFLATSEGKKFKSSIAAAMGETRFERINYPVQAAIKIALREMALFVKDS